MKRNGKNNANSFKDMHNVHVVGIDNEQNRKQIAAEQAAEKQAMYVEFWETMTENEYVANVQMINRNKFSSDSKLVKDYELLQFFKMKIAQEHKQISEESQKFFDLLPQMSESVQKSMIEFINDHFTDEQTHCEYVSLVKMARETAVLEQAELDARAAQDEQELERQERVGDLIEKNLRNEELKEEENDRLEKEFFKGYAQETEIEKATEVTTEILTQNPKTEMKTQEVATENTTLNNTQNIVNQQVTNNTLNVTVETPKPKMSIADKIAEAQKMLTIAEKKEATENQLKKFHGYLHANKDGDNFTLTSLDKAYAFSTNNIELVKEVNTLLERFFKTKIQEFETELSNFQI